MTCASYFYDIRLVLEQQNKLDFILLLLWNNSFKISRGNKKWNNSLHVDMLLPRTYYPYGCIQYTLQHIFNLFISFKTFNYNILGPVASALKLAWFIRYMFMLKIYNSEKIKQFIKTTINRLQEYITLADFEYPVAAHWFIYLLWLKGFSIILLSNHFTMRVPY